MLRNLFDTEKKGKTCRRGIDEAVAQGVCRVKRSSGDGETGRIRESKTLVNPDWRDTQ